MADLRTDVAVVGLGLVGGGAVRHLAEAGVQVVGVGPGEPPDLAAHGGVFASHYDSGRITRLLDARFEWAELARRSIAEYGPLAAATGIDLHWPVGCCFASTDPEYVEALRSVGRRVGAAAREGDPTGGLLAFPAGSTVVAEGPPAGFIDPRRMLRAQHAAATDAGARLLTDQAVDLAAGPDGWQVTTTDGTTVHATTVIVATGAHTSELQGLPPLPRLAVRPEAVVTATLDDAEQRRLGGIPSVLAHLPGSSFSDLYMVPPTPYPDGTVRLKLGATLRSYDHLDTGAARRAWMAGDAHAALGPELRSLVEALVPGIRTEAWETKPCMITETVSGLPVVAHVAPGLVLAAGGNGYAAKSADAIGALAAALATEGRWTDPVLDEAAFAAYS